jgi:hypothetical protein
MARCEQASSSATRHLSRVATCSSAAWRSVYRWRTRARGRASNTGAHRGCAVVIALLAGDAAIWPKALLPLLAEALALSCCWPGLRAQLFRAA